ncbi:homoserine kinase [Kordiimonas sp. SCSIO 12603]|uniref:homoserine kinase n=1 Tax=Kordiimonas sp. SCSIO 12603 TaxID=2829596 RepID=UPI0021028816|nr:homoserine kinase [Kordiimonas sp. SCSIO 12603]UTW58172.1 homoserine kinase [Kordiimonas sp. SCSIO 12603]
MAVYTKVDDQTLNQFLDRYDAGKATSFKGIAEGVENSNYLLSTTKAQYILTLYEKRANPEDLPYFLNMMEHIADKGLPSPRPIRDSEGKALQILSGKPACLISFLSGVSVDETSDAHCAAVGEALALMHNALADFKENRPNDLSLDGWEKLIADTADTADSVSSGLSSFITEEFEFLKAHWPTNLPSGTIHADLFPDNVLFTGHKVTGIIDFYFGCTDALAYDLAICINAWCFDGNHEFVPSRAKRLIEMYDTHRSLVPAELEIFPVLCRGAALRFLLTRLYDWLNPVEGAVVNPKNPLDYKKRIEFHRTVKDTASYVV